MSCFNYQKAYFTLAKPAFENLSSKQRNTFNTLSSLVADLSQDTQLLIPMSDEIKKAFDGLTCSEIAALSHASYYVGHWTPSHTVPVFDNSKGQSWKVSNCCDQVLRARLNPPRRVEIHEGELRFTFSSPDCWMWNEFGMATEENLAIFKRIKYSLPTGEDNFKQACEILKAACGDQLWPNVDSVADNEEYTAWLADRKQRLIQRQHDAYRDTLHRLDQEKLYALDVLEFKLLCIAHDLDIENLIYYSHTSTFCFGWREPVSAETADKIRRVLEGCRYKYEIKVVRQGQPYRTCDLVLDKHANIM